MRVLGVVLGAVALAAALVGAPVFVWFWIGAAGVVCWIAAGESSRKRGGSGSRSSWYDDVGGPFDGGE